MIRCEGGTHEVTAVFLTDSWKEQKNYYKLLFTWFLIKFSRLKFLFDGAETCVCLEK